MANDVTLPGTGAVVDTVQQTDGSHRQKVAIGGFGDNESDVIGSLTETAPASDTASSGLNGRLQRIAQRITSLIALLPSSLGGKTGANSLAVTLASDDPAVATLGATSGAAVITDANGTIQQYLRGLIKQWIAGLLMYGSAVTVSASVTKSTTTTTYTIGDCWSDSTSAPTAGGFTFSNAARISGGSGIITDIFISNSVGPALMLQGELWIYDSAATNDNDNAAFTCTDADVLLAVGVVPFTLAASAVGSVNSYAHITGLNIGFTCVGSANLRFKVKVQNAYVNAASEVLNFRLKIIQTN